MWVVLATFRSYPHHESWRSLLPFLCWLNSVKLDIQEICTIIRQEVMSLFQLVLEDQNLGFILGQHLTSPSCITQLSKALEAQLDWCCPLSPPCWPTTSWWRSKSGTTPSAPVGKRSKEALCYCLSQGVAANNGDFQSCYLSLPLLLPSVYSGGTWRRTPRPSPAFLFVITFQHLEQNQAFSLQICFVHIVSFKFKS